MINYFLKIRQVPMTSYLDYYLNSVPSDQRSRAAIASLAGLDAVAEVAPDVCRAIVDELKAQRSHLKLIASENYSSLPCMLSMGNWLTDKYAEGVAGKRFYAGCEHVDTIESIAAQHAKELFGADHAYVQPHSGADANLVAYFSVLVQRVQQPELAALGLKTLDEASPEQAEAIRQKMVNQTLMGMALDAGGHLTHGYRHSFSSKIMRAVPYGVNPTTGWLDLDALRAQVQKVRPLLLVVGYSSYPRRLNFARLRQIADEVGATLMVDMAHFSGLVAGKVFTGEEDPVPYADLITSTTHKTLRGPRGGIILCRSAWKEVIDKGCPLVLGGPLPHVMAAKAVAFQEALQPSFRTYAQQICTNAKELADRLMQRGVSLITGGTDNHLVMIQAHESFGLTGRQAEMALRSCGLTVNRNSIPNDPFGPLHGSGVRLGTPAVTTLGMKEQEMDEIADLIVTALQAARPQPKGDEPMHRAPAVVAAHIQGAIKSRARDLLHRFPLYPELLLNESPL
jgi:glycine hydroxymethyltransferase